MAAGSNWFVAGGRLRAGWRVTLYMIGYVMLLLVVQTPVALLYIAYLVWVKGMTPAALLPELAAGSFPLWFYLVLKLAELLALVPMTYVLRRWIDRRSFVSLGFQAQGGRWAVDLLLGIVLAGVQMAVIFGIAWGGGWLAVRPLAGPALLLGLVDALLALVLFVLVAVGEELMFRGYIQVNLTGGSGPLVGLVVTSLLFGLVHAANPNFQWLALANIILAGAVLGYARLVSRGLWLPIGYHLAWNFVQGAVLALPVSGVRYGGLLEVVDRGTAPWLTGGPFGPEGGLLGTALLVLSFPILWWWGRRRGKGEKLVA